MEAQPQQQEDRPAVVDAEEAVPTTGDEEEELDVRERERESLFGGWRMRRRAHRCGLTRLTANGGLPTTRRLSSTSYYPLL
jgi:hypothetical protein